MTLEGQLHLKDAARNQKKTQLELESVRTQLEKAKIELEQLHGENTTLAKRAADAEAALREAQRARVTVRAALGSHTDEETLKQKVDLAQEQVARDTAKIPAMAISIHSAQLDAEQLDMEYSQWQIQLKNMQHDQDILSVRLNEAAHSLDVCNREKCDLEVKVAKMLEETRMYHLSNASEIFTTQQHHERICSDLHSFPFLCDFLQLLRSFLFEDKTLRDVRVMKVIKNMVVRFFRDAAAAVPDGAGDTRGSGSGMSTTARASSGACAAAHQDSVVVLGWMVEELLLKSKL